MRNTLEQDIDMLSATIQYIKEYGRELVEEITLIPEEHLESYRKVATAFRIQVEILEGPTTLVVGLPPDFPSQLPMFFDSNKQFGFAPHIEKDGFICFTRNENLVLDEEYPGAIVLDCLKKVIKVLEKNLSGDVKEEFLEEFEVYWGRSSAVTAHCIINEENDSVRELDFNWLSFEDNYYFFINEKSFDPTSYIQKLYNYELGKSDIRRRCLFVPLLTGTFFMPPKPGENWDYDTFYKNLFSNISKENKESLLRYLKRTPKSNSTMDFFVISMPIENKKRSLIGIVLSYPKGMVRNSKARVDLHPLIRKPNEIKLYHFDIERHNKNFLLTRTGGDTELSKKHAVVIGVGSVGSVVGMGLAKLGFGEITFIDKELLSIENVYRHELGVNNIYSDADKSKKYELSKVAALKDEIEGKYPLTTVKPMFNDISNVIEKGLIDWAQTDIVIVCLGSPNIEMMINRVFHKIHNAPPVLYAWVEPLGIGGHVLVTLNHQKKGCYQCLFRRISEGEAIRNLSSFAAPYQSFSKTLNGCGSYFTPYSFLDSEQTAILVLRSVSNVFRAKIQGNVVFSWKGEADTFLDQGFKLSERYSMTDGELMERRSMFIDPKCPVCSVKES
ncbi:E2/UBC family protein [Paenibacillus glucanolyticus]|uniref:ThiF family adenylyltransferase n=1 Tax=Paenibacillus glucanolyticus TaxID=59843 RepID=UPI0030C8E523